MKKLLSVKTMVLIPLLLVIGLTSGTALAGRQAAVSPAAKEIHPEANIVSSSICALGTGTITVWGSGWEPQEAVLISAILGKDITRILFAGTVNDAGAVEIAVKLKPGAQVEATAPGLYSLEALGVSGRHATYPLLVVKDKCPS